MSQFYYSRKCGPNPFAAKWMVSGVRWFLCLADGFPAITIGTKGHREKCVTLMPNIFRMATGLRGHNLACWCPKPKLGEPDICHCTVWLALANDDDPVKTLRPLCEVVTVGVGGHKLPETMLSSHRPE